MRLGRRDDATPGARCSNLRSQRSPPRATSGLVIRTCSSTWTRPGFTRMEPASERAAASSPWLNSTRDKPCQAATWSLSCTGYPATSVGSSFGLSG